MKGKQYLLSPWSATPKRVVRKMLELAEIKPGETLYDLGCGDGRVLIEASKRYGIESVGIECQEKWVRKSNENVRTNGLENLVTIVDGDIFDQDLSGADIVFTYLTNGGMNILKDKLSAELKDDARIVSHLSTFKNVKPKSQHRVYDWQLWFPPRLPMPLYVALYEGKSLRV